MVEQCKPWASVATRKRVWSVTLMQTLHPIPSSKSISIGPNFYWLILPIVDGGSIRPPILLPCLPRSFSPIGQWALPVIRLKAKSIMARSVAGPPMKWEIKRDLAFFTSYLQVIPKTLYIIYESRLLNRKLLLTTLTQTSKASKDVPNVLHSCKVTCCSIPASSLHLTLKTVRNESEFSTML